jgi:hypothetical protein
MSLEVSRESIIAQHINHTPSWHWRVSSHDNYGSMDLCLYPDLCRQAFYCPFTALHFLLRLPQYLFAGVWQRMGRYCGVSGLRGDTVPYRYLYSTVDTPPGPGYTVRSKHLRSYAASLLILS